MPSSAGARRPARAFTVAGAVLALVLGAAAPALGASSPTNSSPPTVTGNPYVGQVLTGSAGTWKSATPLSFATKWQRCDAAGRHCSGISGSAAKSRTSTYALTTADVGRTLRFVVTASNSAGSRTAHSVPTPIVDGAVAPTNTSLPTISGTAQDGRTLTGKPGAWSGGAITYSYVWIRCDGADTCTPTPVTGTTYQLSPADIGSNLTFRVTATGAAGSTTADSAPTDPVTAAPPANTLAPQVAGTPSVGSVLTASPGTWDGSPATYTYLWQRCAGGVCRDIGATATASGYTVVGDDVRSTLRVVVTATNGAGSLDARSAQTSAVIDPATYPGNGALPTVTGVATDGETLTGSDGTWTTPTPGTAIDLSRQWLRCATASTCVPIAGAQATSAAYTLTPDDVGNTLVFQVTATTVGGSAVATSAPTAMVAAARPANTTLPAISGTATDGSTLTADPGTWSGTPPVAFGYDWQRCDSTGAGCVSTGVIASPSYVLSAQDIGHTLRVVVTATNPGPQQGTASSAVTAVVAAAPPVNTELPAVSGAAQSGSTLLASSGSWTGTVPFAFTYLWLRCDNTGAGCAPTSQTTSTYPLTDADVGRTLRVRETAGNRATTASTAPSVTSLPTAVVRVAGPTNTAVPTISGTPQVGATLTAGTGSWTGTGPFTYAYHWFDCDSAGTTCNAVALGDGASTYVLKTSDQSARMVVRVTASNSGGSATAGSAPTAAVAASVTATTVAHWAMDDTGTTMKDDSGNKNNGTLSSVTTGRPGWLGSAFGFFADPSLVTVPTAESLNPGSSTFTVDLHVNFTSVPSATVGDYDLLRKGLASTLGGDYKVEIMSTGYARCYTSGPSGHVSLTAGPKLDNGAWHDVTCVFGPALTQLYVDGRLIKSSTAKVGAVGNTASLLVGAKSTTEDQYSGLMDEVRISVG